ncbi:hypothetical protein KAR91_08590 [Candidatus Pacearchaeota archaeon]|nr:hypothetical protein [Candidatus Pacearchaeota archaeon]
MKVEFNMGRWQRIKAATIMWWAIVFTGEINCCDEEHEKQPKTRETT